MNKQTKSQESAADDTAAGRPGPVSFRLPQQLRPRPAITDDDLTRARSYVDARTPGNVILQRAGGRAMRRRVWHLALWTAAAAVVTVMISMQLPEVLTWWRGATVNQQAGFLTMLFLGLLFVRFLTMLGRLVMDAVSVDGRPAERDIVAEALIATGARPTARERAHAVRAEAQSVLVQGLRGSRERRAAASRNAGGRS